MHAATHMFACSTAASKWLYKNRAERAILLKNGIECEKFQFSLEIREQIRTELQLNENTLVLGHVGRFNHQKNHSFLIDIFQEVNKMIPNSQLILAGDGPLLPTIKKKILELNLEGNVKLLGVRDDIHQLLQAFDIFVFPSLHEGLPVTLIEAQCAGLPCIISNHITTEVDMGVNLVSYLPLSDLKIWCTTIKDLAIRSKSREALLSALSEKGYDIRNTAQSIGNTYLSLLG